MVYFINYTFTYIGEIPGDKSNEESKSGNSDDNNAIVIPITAVAIVAIVSIVLVIIIIIIVIYLRYRHLHKSHGK